MRTSDGFGGIDPDELLHAGSTASMLVDAHHHGSVLILIELAHAEETLLLNLVDNQLLYLLVH